ncbi:MAG: hypothetical protein LBU85_05305 [Treponema sp.]|nr:hypothetical protein [Treponema sp.]
MKRKKTMIVPAIIALLLAAVGCAGSPEKGDQSSTAKEAKKAVSEGIYKDDPRGTLNIVNNMDVPLILFVGSINNNNMIGGVLAESERNFDITKKLPESSNNGSFLLRAVREADYSEFGSKLEERHIRYASLITYDKKDMRLVRRIIQKDLGGDAQVIINNDSDLILEIRLNKRDGHAITTLGPWERDKVVYLDPNSRGYTFYPVWQFYDKASGGVRSIQPEGLNDTFQMRPVVPGSPTPIPRLPFSLNNDNLFTPFATLTVSNETYNGINFQRGTSPLTCQNGYEMINPGAETFELDLNRQPVMVIGGFSIDIGRGVRNYIPVPEFRYEAGYNYVLRLRSDGTLAPIERSSKMDTTGNLRINLINEN